MVIKWLHNTCNVLQTSYLQGSHYQGKSGRNLFFWKVRESVLCFKNWGKSGNCFYHWWMVRESQGILLLFRSINCITSICSVSKFICLSTYDCTEINQPINIICRHLVPVYFKVHAIVKWAPINISWLLLNKTIRGSVRESQGKVALKSQGKSVNFVRTCRWEPCI